MRDIAKKRPLRFNTAAAAELNGIYSIKTEMHHFRKISGQST